MSTIYIYIYVTVLASNEIFSPSNKIHREVGRAKDLSAHLYYFAFFPSSNEKLQITPYSSKGGENEVKFPYVMFIY